MDLRARWPASRLLVAAVAILIIVSAGAITGIAVAMGSLSQARERLLDRVVPAQQAVQDLDSALINQETGLRGFAITAHQDFLSPYLDGQDAERRAEDETRALLAEIRPDLAGEVDAIGRSATDWRLQYAEGIIAQVHLSGAALPTLGDVTRGKELFDRVRAAVADLRGDLDAEARAARQSLDEVAAEVVWLSLGLGVLLVVIIAGVAVVLHRIVIAPLAVLAAQARKVASGDYAHAVDVAGPRETVMLAHDVDAMRQRIVSDLKELQRSNSELEQFAYVASHDLQEPLRKVASFCQLLERRYSGQLDERGEQYIQFAVDGAKRMQVLINDLLAFSRVGRITREQTIVDCDELVAQVEDSYSEVIERTGATIVRTDLPRVRGEASLLGGVFGNLVSNALKFHGEDPPVVRISAERTGELWTFTVQDNGIGIAPEYAERIFVIFQRLHHKDDYPGTGIGLAMCRKIVEYHGGTIWLEPGQGPGTTFKFTLPVVEEEETGDTDE
ncbi:sensor histidine kinase [Saccharothrix coeruleofusca]|uniref:histidine kinase n=1 Tax=Saccharothrix coeruleofusca TaxID=33919 RepID=A0A918AR36_9PSEU|nr:sensor histidine kinase [Saccharothrix coeruleofusca]GGP64517.1 histidine kinase [Saccharothrix coeruleofusca]